MVFELYGLNYQIDLKLVCNVLSTASNSSTEKIISNIHHLCETYKWTLSDVPLLLNCKFINYLMVGNIHRSQHNAKGNMFWYFSAPFISPFLHPNFAIRLISSWNQHFLECNLHRTVEHFISSQPHPTICKAKDASITTNNIATWSYMNQWQTLKNRKIYFLLTCIWVLSGAKTTMVLLSIPICEVNKANVTTD